jgi:hypothetical protein
MISVYEPEARGEWIAPHILGGASERSITLYPSRSFFDQVWFEIAIGLSSRQAELARQRHGSLRHASYVREQPPRRSQSVGLLCSRRTNHMTQR